MFRKIESWLDIKEERGSMEVNMLLFPRPRKGESREPSAGIDTGNMQIGLSDFDIFDNAMKKKRDSLEMNNLLFPRPRKGEEVVSTAVFVERRRYARN